MRVRECVRERICNLARSWGEEGKVEFSHALPVTLQGRLLAHRVTSWHSTFRRRDASISVLPVYSAHS